MNDSIMRSQFEGYGILSGDDLIVSAMREIGRISMCDGLGMAHDDGWSPWHWFNLDFYMSWHDWEWENHDGPLPPWRDPDLVDRMMKMIMADGGKLLNEMEPEGKDFWCVQLVKAERPAALVLNGVHFQTMDLSDWSLGEWSLDYDVDDEGIGHAD